MKQPNPFSLLDKFVLEFDAALRTVMVPSKRAMQKETPSSQVNHSELTQQEKRHVAGLMRVNHSGEVCAQALYRGQALTAKLPKVRAQMEEAAQEEIDHLAWCEERLNELNSHPSALNAFWYMGSFLLGAAAGAIGDHLSLGFVAETEKQVTAHLENHLARLPQQDKKTEAILTQMRTDEMQHAAMAKAAGGVELPLLAKKLMRLVSKCMTTSSYYF